MYFQLELSMRVLCQIRGGFRGLHSPSGIRFPHQPKEPPRGTSLRRTSIFDRPTLYTSLEGGVLKLFKMPPTLPPPHRENPRSALVSNDLKCLKNTASLHSLYLTMS